MNVLLGILLWAAALAEVFFSFCFVDITGEKGLVSRNKGRVAVGTFIIGTLAALNRSGPGGLVSWPIMLLQCILAFFFIRKKIQGSKKQCFTTLLAYYLFSTLIQLFLAMILLILFPKVDFDQLYLSYGIYKVGCNVAAVLVVCVVYGVFAVLIRKLHSNLELLRRAFYIYDLAAFYLMFIFQLQVEDYGRNRSWENAVNILLFLTMAVVLFFIYLKNADILTEFHLLEYRSKLMEENYGEIQRIYQDFSYTYHDMKNHLLVLKHYCEEGNLENARAYIEKLQDSQMQVKEYICSGSKVTDMVLNFKLSQAEKSGIQIQAEADPIPDLYIEENDWCAILGNLLDNAIEACQKMSHEERWIHLQIKEQGEMLIVVVSNTFSAESVSASEKGGKKLSSGKRIHGYGMKSVKAKAEKYGGSASWSQEGHIYRATIIICNQKQDKKEHE